MAAVAAAMIGGPVVGFAGQTGAGSTTQLTYVALGDSYASGPLIPNQQMDPLGCLRSDHNFASLTAAALGLSLTDMSCAGAEISQMTTSQNVTIGTNPPQLSALSPSTSVVSLQISGNDIGFSSIIENCAALTPWGPTSVGQTCQGHYDSGGVNQLANSINAVAPRLATVIQEIHADAPAAKVFVVGYPDILPSTGDGCWPALPLTFADSPYLYNTEVELDTMIATEAKENGATYVDTFTPSENYNACTSSSTRWIEPLIPDTLAAPVHPNATGEAGMAGLLEAAMRAQGIS
jgi:lysophospholipase L1-like esterase